MTILCIEKLFDNVQVWAYLLLQFNSRIHYPPRVSRGLWLRKTCRYHGSRIYVFVIQPLPSSKVRVFCPKPSIFVRRKTK
jgi:hypothetical protein